MLKGKREGGGGGSVAHVHMRASQTYLHIVIRKNADWAQKKVVWLLYKSGCGSWVCHDVSPSPHHV